MVAKYASALHPIPQTLDQCSLASPCLTQLFIFHRGRSYLTATQRQVVGFLGAYKVQCLMPMVEPINAF